MPARVIWRRLAEEDLAEAYLHIGAGSPAAAERLIAAVENSLELLRRNAGAGHLREFRSPRAQGVRSWALKGFPVYLIFYRCEGDDLEVVRLLHGARDLPRLLEEEG